MILHRPSRGAAGLAGCALYLASFPYVMAQAASTLSAPSSPVTPIARANTKWPVTIHAAARDAQGNLYVTGSRLLENIYGLGLPSTLFPATALQAVYAAKFDANGNTVYEISIGGHGNDAGLGIAADANGNAYVVGATTSQDFPQKNSIQGPASSNGDQTGFVLKLDGAGNLQWSTYFGSGGVGASVNAVAVDGSGNAYITGQTDSQSLPVTPGAFQNSDVATTFSRVASFVAKFAASGTLVYSTYLGSTGGSCYGVSRCVGALARAVGTAIGIDSAGNAYVAGATNEQDFPGAAPISWPGSLGFPNVPFLVKLNSDGSGIVFGTYLHGPVVAESEISAIATALSVDAAGNAYVAGTAGNSADFPTTTGVLAPAPQPGGSNPFVMKFSPAGTLQFSTFLGSSGADTVSALSVAPSGDIYVSGTTRSTDFPTTATLFANGFNYVAELNPLATTIVNSVRLPGGVTDAALLAAGDDTLIAAGSSGLLSQVDLPVAAPGTPVLLGAGNAALPGLGGGIAAGLVSVYGLNIGPSTPVTADASSGQLPATLGGVQVLVQDTPGVPAVAVPLLYVSANQINAVVPPDIFSQRPLQITIANGAATAGPIQVALQQADPEIFRNLDGSAVAVNQDGSLNSPSNPADRSSIVAIFGTGIPNFGSGDIALPGCATGAVDPRVTVSGTPPVYFGCSPGSASAVFQINFPARACLGQNCTVTYNGTPGQPFTIYTK